MFTSDFEPPRTLFQISYCSYLLFTFTGLQIFQSLFHLAIQAIFSLRPIGYAMPGEFGRKSSQWIWRPRKTSQRICVIFLSQRWRRLLIIIPPFIVVHHRTTVFFLKNPIALRLKTVSSPEDKKQAEALQVPDK